MNFGEILDKWEKRQSGDHCANNNAMEKWLKDNDVYDKDADMHKTHAAKGRKRRPHNIQPDDILDLHGQTAEQAWLSLEHFFSIAKQNNYEKLRIIHGKGNHSKTDAILVQVVRSFIEQCSFAGESGYEKASGGGSGATWVFLKTKRY